MDKFVDFITSQKFYLPFVYVVLGLLLNFIINNIINRVTSKHKKNRGRDKRIDTIINLVKNILKYLILIFVILGILKLYGIDTTSIIASLGIVAAITGLAFQDILKDLLAGASIIFDNKYAVGDYIKINDFEGTVLELGLRTTKIKAYNGQIKSISNSSFTEVINYSIEDSVLSVNLNVAYDTDISKLEEVLNGISKEVLQIEGVTSYELMGINEFGDSSVVYLVCIGCKAVYRYSARRDFLRLIKDTFDKENIKIPYTTLDINLRK